MLDVLSACALITFISLSVFTANEHFNTTLKMNKVRTAAAIFAQDLRRLQRYTMFQSSGTGLTIKTKNGTEYRVNQGLTVKRTVNFKDIGCDGVYFSKSLSTGSFSATGTPAYTGDYELRHKELENFSCTLSLQPVTGRVIILEGQ